MESDLFRSKTLYNIFQNSSSKITMAEAAIIEDKDAYPVECGYCLEDEGFIRNPKMLPCGHAFCEKCLSGKQEDINYIECPVIDCK